MLPLVIHQVALGYEGRLANITGVRLLALVLDPDVFVNTCFVKRLVANRAGRVERALFVFGQKVGLVLEPDVSGQT